MKKNYFIIALIIALAICVAFLLWPDKQHDTHKDDRADVIAANDTLKAHDAKSARIIDSLNKTIAAKDSVNKALRESQAVTRRQLDSKTAEVIRLSVEVKAMNIDTGYFARKVDSLVAQVESLTFLIVQYEQYADSINNVNDSMKVSYETVIKEKDKAKAELQAAYDKLYKSYIDLFDTTAGLQKSLRRQKLKTKVVAVLGGALSIIALLKQN